VKNDMQIAQDEMFGPIAPIIRVDGEAEALRVANVIEFGLSSVVFTRNQARGLQFALGVEAGMTHINNHCVDDTLTGPFGGEKNSGLGRFRGEWIIREFTRDHWITAQHARRSYSLVMWVIPLWYAKGLSGWGVFLQMSLGCPRWFSALSFGMGLLLLVLGKTLTNNF
jgi:hypothetical protein